MNEKLPCWVIVTPGFPANAADSTCLPLQQALALSLKAQLGSTSLFIVSLQYPFEKGSYNWKGITVYSAAGKNKNGLARRLCWHRANRFLKKLSCTYHIQTMLSFWCDEAALLAGRFAKKINSTHYCWICGQDAKAGNRMVHKIKPEPEELVAISDSAAFLFKRNYNIQPAHTIYPGIDPALFGEPPATKTIDLLAAGSLVPLKQMHRFIELVDRIRKNRPTVLAVLAGDGPERKKLEQLVHEKNLGAHIRITGELPHSQLLNLMQQSRVLVHPSSYEGFGMVQAEALFAGCAVVSFVQPVAKEIPGWNIVADTDAMFEKTVQLLNKDPEPALSPFPFLINETAAAFIRLAAQARH